MGLNVSISIVTAVVSSFVSFVAGFVLCALFAGGAKSVTDGRCARANKAAE
jgi:hypothetical protein